MENQPPQAPTITSFVIRFIQEPSPEAGEAGTYRGSIHHVQSSQELLFTRWEEAVEFIQRFFPLVQHDQPGNPYPPVES